MIYLDNAASSFPKPPGVVEAVSDCLTSGGASPGRGQHKMALAAGRIVMNTRRTIATLLGAGNPGDIVFTANATEALNLAIRGWVRPGDSVVTTVIEHNSVYRPLARAAETLGVSVEMVQCDAQGRVDVDEWRRKVTRGTRLAILTHASNVLGTIQDLEPLIDIAKRAQVPILVDAAQSAGAIELDIDSLGADMLAFTGHKSLLGPQGTGGLYVSPNLEIAELMTGGTGGGSKGPQPLVRPDRYESGTYNTPGLAGLGAAGVFLIESRVSRIFEVEQERIQRLIEGLMKIKGVIVYGPPPGKTRASLVSLNLRGVRAQELAAKLDKEYDVCSRSGWLCAPEVHGLIGTSEAGVLRLSPGYFSSDDEIDEALFALGEIGRKI